MAGNITLRSAVSPATAVNWKGTTDGAAHVHLVTTLAGEDAVRDVQKVLEETPYSVIGTSGPTVLKSAAGALYGASILSTASTGVLTFYDGLTTAGQALYFTAGLGMSTAAEIFWTPGKRFASGLTVNVSASLQSTAGVLVWWK